MPDLETLLRDVKPAPDPTWAAKLDSRVLGTVINRSKRKMDAYGAYRAHAVDVRAATPK